MKSKQSSFLHLSLLIQVLVSGCVASQYKVTTISVNSSHQNKSVYQNSSVHIFTSGNDSLIIQHTFLGTNYGLFDIINKFDSNEIDLNDKERIFTSHLGTKVENVIGETLKWKQREYHTLQVSDCSQVYKNSQILEKDCGRYKSIYAQTIAAFAETVLPWPIAVIVENSTCAQQFFKIVNQRLQEMLNRHSKSHYGRDVVIYKLEESFDLLTSLSKTVLFLTTKYVATVILLCNEEYTELLFKYAKHFRFPLSDKTWIMLESVAAMNDKTTPQQLLNFKQVRPTCEKLFLIDPKGIDLLNIKIIASKWTSRSNHTNRLASHIDLQHTSNESYCKRKDKNVQSTLVTIRKSKFHWLPLYEWTSENKIAFLSGDKSVARLSRSTLHSTTIKVTTLIERPFIMTSDKLYDMTYKSCIKGLKCRVAKKMSHQTIWVFTCCIGYLMDLLEKLKKDLSLNIDLYHVEDGLYGTMKNGTWNGLIAELINGKADMIFAPLTATTLRSKVIDFGETFMGIDLAFLLLKRNHKKPNFVNFDFMAMVHGNLLWAILGIFIVGLALLYVLENRLKCLAGREGQASYPMQESFTYFSGLTFQRDLGGHNPKHVAARITAISFAFGMVIIMSTYTAMLTANKVKMEETSVFLGMKDPKITNPTNDFKFACLESSSTEQFLKDSHNVVLKNMYLFMKDYNTATTEIGVKRVINGELQAFLAEYPNAQYYASSQKDCGLRIVKASSKKASWNVAFPKGSLWQHLISKMILEYKESGFLVSANKRWLQTSCRVETGNTQVLESIKIENVVGVFIILSASVVFAVLLLLPECTAKRFSKRHMNSYSFD